MDECKHVRVGRNKCRSLECLLLRSHVRIKYEEDELDGP
jgi:hypothetical protein